MNNTSGFYLGIVIQNNDPEKRGRVKVFIPHISAALYPDWNKTFKDGEDKHFVFPDKNTNPDLDKVFQYLKESLPWAEIASSIFGGSASGRYNAYAHRGSTSDSNIWNESGFRPSQAYIRDHRISDAFSDTGSANRFVNPNANQYTPSDYSNLARGVFTIPNVGAHVWVFFANGDANFPVVFAASHGQDDWMRIYSGNKDSSDVKVNTSPDYPGCFENVSSEDTPTLDHNHKTFRSKHVINTNKHSIELIDTDKSELLKLTHYSGSFLEFNNQTTSRFSSHNDQLLVLGDQFLTIRKNQSIYVASYQESIIRGDQYVTVGDFDKRRALGLEILRILRDTHEYKRLFECMRIGKHLPYTSRHQKQIGEYAPCPVCGGAGIKFDLPCVTCSGTGDSPSTQDGKWELDDIKWPSANMIKLIQANQKKIIDLDLEGLLGNGGDNFENISGNRTTNIGAVFNDLASYRVDPKGKIRNDGVWIGKSGTYVCMNSAPLVEYVDVDSVPGGDWDVTVGNKYTLTVGSKGIHIVTTGPVNISGTIMNISGESLNVSGKHEVLIQSGDEGNTGRIELQADIINLKPTDRAKSSVLVDGQLGVRDNLKVVGGAHIEGELSYLHSTTPFRWYKTEIGYGPVPHFHLFKAPPWTLLDKCDDVRLAQQSLNHPNPAGNIECPGFWVPG